MCILVLQAIWDIWMYFFDRKKTLGKLSFLFGPVMSPSFIVKKSKCNWKLTTFSSFFSPIPCMTSLHTLPGTSFPFVHYVPRAYPGCNVHVSRFTCHVSFTGKLEIIVIPFPFGRTWFLVHKTRFLIDFNVYGIAAVM